MFDYNFCLKNRFYDKSYNKKQNLSLYKDVKIMYLDIISSISKERNLDQTNILSLETYKILDEIKNNHINLKKYDIIVSDFFLHKINEN